jgi:DNA-binding CsgD family transcriptional regulator
VRGADNQNVFVGRKREGELLLQRLREGQPAAVLGEAGVGKTTLIREAVAREGTRLVEAGGLATLSWLPYLPLRRAFGREFEGDAAHVAAEVEEAVGEATLFLDDLQWADAQTAALLPLLAGRIPLVIAVRRGAAETSAALEVAAAAGAELLPLEPLAQVEAAELARALHPGLTEPALRRLAERSGGNPFLLEQLAESGEAGKSLRLSVAASLRCLSPAGGDAIAALALLGRPAEPRLLGAGTAEILAAGFASGDDDVTIRHALLAEATAETLSADEQRRIHSRLASALDDPGEAARHYAAAGERVLAHREALLALERASTPGERATHLEVAAANADGTEAAALRVRAASALAEGGRYEAAESLLQGTQRADSALAAESALIRSRAREVAGDVSGARAALSESDGIAVESDVEVRLVIQRVRLLLAENSDPAATLEHAAAAYALARSLRSHETEALEALAKAKREAGRDDWDEDLRTVIAAAGAAGDAGLEFAAAETLGAFLFGAGRGDEGRTVVAEAAGRARELELPSWERRLLARAAWIDLHGGRFSECADEGEALLLEALDPWQRFLVAYLTAQASIDLGRHRRARELIDELARRTVSEEHERQRLWTLADAEFWAGRPRDAIAAAEELLGRFPLETSAFARLTRAWAYLDLDLDPGPPTVAPGSALLAGAQPELEGVWRLAQGRYDEAAKLFAEAAARWAQRHVRGELRSLWAEGEALRRAAGRDDAVERLLAAERRATEHAHQPLVDRTRRSLRLIGVRRDAPRQRAGVLTGRELEVLELVAEGLVNDEIARRLGLGRPTVVRLIRSAQQKLGAGNRAQAAALAIRQ